MLFVSSQYKNKIWKPVMLKIKNAKTHFQRYSTIYYLADISVKIVPTYYQYLKRIFSLNKY